MTQITSNTHTMENTTEGEYISIYDKPKRGRGKPRGSKYTEEEKAQKAKEATLKYRDANFEYYSLQKRLYMQRAYAVNKQKEI